MRTIQNKKPERLIAHETGESKYFTGRPCKSGHVAYRFTVDASCCECREVAKAARQERGVNALYMREKRQAALAHDPEGTREKWRNTQWAERLLYPEKVRARDRHHSRLKRQRNPKGKLAEVRKRQIAKLCRTPAWADLKAIREFYVNCPDGMEVDHIVPLRGKTVSGLHVLENLQYITPLENREKGNRFDAKEASWQEFLRLMDLKL